MQKSLYLGRFFTLLIKPYKGVLRTSEEGVHGTSLRDVLRASVVHICWSYMIDHKGKWRSSHNVRMRHPQGVGRRRHLVLHLWKNGDFLRTLQRDVLIESYLKVLRKSVEAILRASVGSVSWRYIEYHRRPSIERLFGISCGRKFADWVCRWRNRVKWID